MRTNIAVALSKINLKTNLNQSIFSLSFDILGLLTGTLLVLYFGFLKIEQAPWALLLYPGILSVRGAVGGLFSGHLGTSLHLGTIKPVFRNNTKDFQNLIWVIITLAFISGLSIGVGTWIIGFFLWSPSFIDLISLLTVIMSTMALSVVFISPLTITFSVFSFRRGLDPDVIVYPATSPVSDIISTSCYVLSFALFFFFGDFGRYLIWLIDIFFIFSVVYLIFRNLSNSNFGVIIKEFIPTLLFITFISNITGSLLNRLNGKMFYRVYPAIIATIGGVGSIIGSTATTKLALGLIKPTLSSIKQHFNEISGAWLASILMFIIYAILSSFISSGTNLEQIIIFSGQLLITNLLAVFIMIFIVYSVAIFTFKGGWNPDNFVIPIVSSLADTITTASIIISLILIL
jgi:mgtE-like transporter